MKRINRMLALLLALLLISAFAAPALAVSPEFTLKTLPLKQWIDVEKNAWGLSLYKVKIGADSRMTINWRNCTDSNYYFLLFKTSAAAASGSAAGPLISLGPDDKAAGSKNIAVAKGTYYAYFICDVNNEHPAGQVKVSTAQLTDRKNYTPASAYALKRNTLEKISQVPLKAHVSWYRISLTKKQKITVATNEGAEGKITIYDKGMKQVNVSTSSKKVVTSNTCPKGTYYIRVGENTWFNNRYTADSYITLKWK